MGKIIGHKILVFFAEVIGLLIVACICTALGMWIWNTVLVALFDISKITFIQFFGLEVLVDCLLVLTHFRSLNWNNDDDDELTEEEMAALLEIQKILKEKEDENK